MLRWVGGFRTKESGARARARDSSQGWPRVVDPRAGVGSLRPLGACSGTSAQGRAPAQGRGAGARMQCWLSFAEVARIRPAPLQVRRIWRTQLWWQPPQVWPCRGPSFRPKLGPRFERLCSDLGPGKLTNIWTTEVVHIRPTWTHLGRFRPTFDQLRPNSAGVGRISAGVCQNRPHLSSTGQTLCQYCWSSLASISQSLVANIVRCVSNSVRIRLGCGLGSAKFGPTLSMVQLPSRGMGPSLANIG